MPFKNSEQASKAGRLGGLKTKQRLTSDPDYFARIGRAGGETIKRTRGVGYYAMIGRMPKREDRP